MNAEAETEAARQTKTIRVSPSQLHTADLCTRKWAWKYIAQMPEPQTASQTAGLDLHRRVEAWLGQGTHPGSDAIGKLVQAAIRPGVLPTPSRALRLEAKFELPLADNVAFTGFIDCLVPPTDANRFVTVIDHKSTSNLRWAKSVQDLAHDPQVIGYSKAASDWYPDAVAVEARWVYYQRNTTRIHPVSLTLDRATLAERWDALAARALRLADLRRASPDPNTVDANPEACETFGGCPFATVCFARGQTRSFFPEPALLTLPAISSMNCAPASGDVTTGDPSVISLQEQLAKLRAGIAGTKESSKENEPQGVASLDARQAATAARGVNPPAPKAQNLAPNGPTKGADTPEGIPVASPWSAPVLGAPTRSTEVATVASSPLPWQAQAPSSGKVVEQTMSAAERAVQLKKELEELEARAQSEAAEARAQAEAEAKAAEAYAQAEAEAKAAEETRQKQAAKVRVKKAPRERTVEEVSVELSREQPVRGHSQELEASSRDLLTVCFGVAFLKAPTLLLTTTTNLVDLLAPIMQEVADAHGVAHWNLVPYAQGKTHLAVAFDKWLTDTGWRGTILVGSSDEAFAVREVLIAHADVVLQGTRA